jgi:DNA-binding CsgD family transcriptional regulator
VALVDTLVAAADRAGARGAPAAAEAPLRRALAEPPEPERRPAILLALGAALSHGSERSAAEAFAEAARTSDDPELRTRALEARARVLWASAPESVDGDLAQIDAVIAALGPEAGGLRLRLEAARLSVAQRSSAALPDALARAERSGVLAAEHPDALAHAAFARMHSSEPAAVCAELALRATRAAAAAGAYGATPPGLWFPFSTIVLQAAERLDEAAASARALQEATRANGSATWYGLTTQWHARLLADRGDLDAAEEEARLAVAAVEATEDWMRALPVRTLAAVLLERGQTQAAMHAWSVLGLGEEIPDSRPFTELLLMRARLREALGDLAGALADAAEAGRRFARVWAPSMNDQEARLLGARLALAGGARDEARAAAATALDVAERWAAPGAIGTVLRLQGAIEQSVELWRAAVDRLASAPLQLEHARALADLGAALRRANHRSEAREPLREALDLARAGQADALAATVETELAATGARVPARRHGGADALTPAERRITRLAAEGATNKEIAQALFVSVKTVEMHLGNAYRKLDVSSRRELARRLAL